MDSAEWLQLQRTVRFGDTDAAGVMHFHQLLRWCHEAYEESLERFGLPARAVFPIPEWAQAAEASPGEQTTMATTMATTMEETSIEPSAIVALPIVHCSADFRRPLVCGDVLGISLRPERLDLSCFELRCSFQHHNVEVATGLTRHLAILATTRQRCPLPTPIQRWLEASSLGLGVRPL